MSCAQLQQLSQITTARISALLVFFFPPRLFSYFEGGSKFLMEIQMFHKGDIVEPSPLI